MKRQVKVAPHLLAILGYTLLTLFLTYPVFLHLGSEVAGFKGEDNLQWRWFLWWFKYSTLTLEIPVTKLPLLYAPTGGEQPLYAVSALTPALALPVTLAAGPTVSFNLSFLLAFILSGYTAYLLAFYLTRCRLPAFVAGLIFTFYPARFGYATGTFLGQLSVYLLPLYLLALLMLARRPTWPRAIWMALVLSCLCLTWPLHVAYGVVMFTLPFMAWQGVRWVRHPHSRVNLKYFAAAFGLALLLLLGPYWPLLTSLRQGENTHLGDSQSTKFSVDLLAFVAPSNYHPLWQPLGLLPGYVSRVLADRDDIQERLAYLGFIPLFLALVALLKAPRRQLFWLVMALSALVLSLGPILKFNGDFVRIDVEGYVGYIILPYTFLRSLPVVDWSETLGRLNVITMLSLAMMAAYGLSYLLGRLRQGGQVGLAALLALGILLEYVTIFPFPTDPAPVPAFYDQLAQNGTDIPEKIIDLPLAQEPNHNNLSMHYQTVHHQAIAGGHFIRKPAGAQEMSLFLDRLLSPSLTQTAFNQPEPQARLALLNHFGFSKIVVRPWLMADEHSQAQRAYLEGWLGQPQSKGEVAIFELPPAELKTSPLMGLLDGEGWQVAAEGLRLEAPAELLVYLGEEIGEGIILHLTLSAPSSERYLSIEIDQQPALRLYLAQEPLNYDIPVQLLPGFHRLTFRPEEACQRACEPVVINQMTLAPFTGKLTSIDFGGQLALIKQEVSTPSARPGQPILIYLYWQSQARLSGNYSAFVHLVSPTGQFVIQADYLLGGWLYPTSRWPAWHITGVPTLFFIPAGTPPGEYSLQTGLYRADTGERLQSGTQDYAVVSKITVTP